MSATENLLALSRWIDESPANRDRDEEAALWGRVSKVTEEAGESIAALIGATGQNPRKGVTHNYDDVEKELLDVAVTALGAIAHMSGNLNVDPLALLEAHIEQVARRAGVSV